MRRFQAAADRKLAERLQRLDSNNDGSEIGIPIPRLLEHVDRIDASRDGRITRDRTRAARAAMRQQAR